MNLSNNTPREAVVKALTTRNKTPINPGCAIDIYDICEKNKLSVIFGKMDSVEGVFKKDANLIIISNQRPLYKQRYTCAHEFAHFMLRHESEIISIDGTSNRNKAEEQTAELFAGHFLMPLAMIEIVRKQEDIDFKTADSCDLCS